MVIARSRGVLQETFATEVAAFVAPSASMPAISHGIVVQGVVLTGPTPSAPVSSPPALPPVPALPTQSLPALLQMNDDDFPVRFLTDLTVQAVTKGSTVTTLEPSSTSPITLYQPVQRIVHVALLKLTCESVGFPRLDPARVASAGLVIRRIRRPKGQDLIDEAPSAWMRSPQNGTCGWVNRSSAQNCLDPDPSRQPLQYTGQAALDQMLSAKTLAATQAEAFTPAFVASPAVCNAAGTTYLYAVIPTASSEISTLAPTTPVYGAEVANMLTNLLSAVHHTPIMPNVSVTHQWMSDEYANAHNSSFITFSKTLRLLYSVLGTFDGSDGARPLLDELNKYNVLTSELGTVGMGNFYQIAASRLMDYDPFNDGLPVPTLTMPDAWDSTNPDTILAAIKVRLVSRSSAVAVPSGRFQDPSRLYRLRVFIRVKGHTPSCPAKLVWSNYSDPFRIAAWHEGGGRPMAPIPLPDPTKKSFRANAKPNCTFAVPSGLMNLMNNTTLSGLSSGSVPGPAAAGGINLNWICGFNIPIITICAFVILNILLILLNLLFWWLPFVKICIPFPFTPPGAAGENDGE